MFVVNRYVQWHTDLPDRISDEITLEPTFREATVDGQVVKLADEDERERAWEELGGEDTLDERVGEDRIRVKDGNRMEVLARLIDAGNLPFSTEPIQDEDIRGLPQGFDPRPYQQEAWETFQRYGSAGMYWPPGAGKTQAALAMGDGIKGDKLVLVPNTTLQQQWSEDIETVARRPEEWEVRTYQYITTGDNINDYRGEDAPTVAILDEVHHLPANTYSEVALLDFDYRIGLTASPMREDGRTEYIYALGGAPCGVDWERLVEEGWVQFPEVYALRYATRQQKVDDAVDLANEKPGTGWVYCDSIDLGEELANRLEVPFVNGEMPPEQREEIISDPNHNIIVISRVGDEGVSPDSLDWTIEVDFLGGSRQQETQRGGRTMHPDRDSADDESDTDGDLDLTTGAGSPQHIVLMTDREYQDHHQRLHAWESAGATLRIMRRD